MIRNGYVSNSSSSSFILLLRREPGGLSDIAELVFGSTVEALDKLTVSYDYAEGTYLTRLDAAGRILDGLKPMNCDTLANDIRSEYYWCHDRDGQDSLRNAFNLSGSDLADLTLNRNESHRIDNKYYECERRLRKQFDAAIGLTLRGGEYYDALAAFCRADPEFVELDNRRDTLSREYDEMCSEIAARLMLQWTAEGLYVCTCTFGDEDGSEGAIMEHGDAFDGVRHFRVSHH